MRRQFVLILAIGSLLLSSSAAADTRTGYEEATSLIDEAVGELEPIPICKGMSYLCPPGNCAPTFELVAIKIECSMAGTVCCLYTNYYFLCEDAAGNRCGNWCFSVGGPSPGQCVRFDPPVVLNPGFYPPIMVVGNCQ